MLTGVAAVAAALGVSGRYTTRRAFRRIRSIEDSHPPQGVFVDVDGRRVHVVVQGTGPDLVLIHGAGGNAQDFTHRFAKALTDRYRVFAVDRPGLGYTDRVRPGLNAAFTTDAESPAEQARFLAAATRQMGADNPIVLGHSYGGAVAMAWALNEAAAGLVILSGATMPWPGPLRRYYRVFGSQLGSALGAPLVCAFATEARIRRALSSVFAPAPVDPAYYHGAAVPLAVRTRTFRANGRQVRALRANLVEMSARYGEIQIPVEILHGTADTTVRPEIHAEPLARLLPNANLVLMEEIGHAPHNVAPEPVIAAIDRVAQRAGLHPRL